jgi:ferrochelatase
MKGVLLIQLGTPKDPSVKAVRSFLREFLSDPMVLDIHPIGRWSLLNLIILPFRPAKSAAAYQQVWMEEGSPIMVHSKNFTAALSQNLGQSHVVALSMRYGQPSISAALDALDDAGVDEIIVLPLYPQYAMSSTGSALAALYEEAASRPIVPPLQVLPDFYSHRGYLDAVTAGIKQKKIAFKPDHILFSYHGLPERQTKSADRSNTHCLASSGCCDQITKDNRSCYRAQCFATTRGIVERMGLLENDYSQGFQSRMGRTPWIKPYTDELLVSLAASGVKRLLVSCPSFVTDCLETLEEIGIRGKADFIAAGGEDLLLAPCLNDDDAWVETVADMIRGI